jgi:hypothetical protein
MTCGLPSRPRRSWRNEKRPGVHHDPGQRGTAIMTQPGREAALKPQASNAYPYLPVRMWISAGRLAALVGRYGGEWVQASGRANRVLSDADFMFRDLGNRPSTVP